MIRRARTSAAQSTRRDRESGQALLELALVVPLLVLLVMAIFQFAYVLESQIGLTNAVREAGRRVAATEPAGVVDWTAETNWVVDQLCGTTPGSCASGLFADNVQGFDDSRLAAGNPIVTFCTDTVGGDAQYRVRIDVHYGHPVFFGPMGFATDLVDGVPDGDWEIGASATMRMENVDGLPVIQNAPPGGTCS